MAEEFERFFSSIVGIMGKTSEDAGDAELEVEVGSTFRFKEIEERDVLKTLPHLNLNKACGMDGISAKVLRGEGNTSGLHTWSPSVLAVCE